KKDTPEDMIEMARAIGSLIDETAIEVFIDYRTKLMGKPITYIVPAVWGVEMDGGLDGIQSDMTRRVGPVVDDIFRRLRIANLTESQAFAIGYLIRGLIVSKVTYMIEAFRNLTETHPAGGGIPPGVFEDMEPVGTA
ncbi:MAG: hypothetical protein JW821_12095, partial [Deltaproteobacteria bacterium]|nr:hypothetical protein [Deltaproteobacteria bacterium]